MEPKQNYVTFISNSYLQSHHHHHHQISPIKKEITHRTPSLYAISSRYKDESYSLLSPIRDEYRLKPPELHDTLYPIEMTSVIEKRLSSTSMEKRDRNVTVTVAKESYQNNSVLREKICNNDILNNSNYNESVWLCCDVDAIKEKMKNSRPHHNNQHYDTMQNKDYNDDQKRYELRYRYSESEKETNGDFKDVTKRCIRARSESEPNSICNMMYGTLAEDLNEPKQNDGICKKNGARQALKKGKPDFSYKLPPKHPISNGHSSSGSTSCGSRRVTSFSSSPRVPIYSNSARSPGIIRKSRMITSSIQSGQRLRSSPNSNDYRIGCGNDCYSPRARDIERRCKTQSPSPTFIRRKYYSGGPTSVGSLRKAKSVTPPPRKVPLPSRVKPIILSEKSEPAVRTKHDSDESELDDDDLEDDFNDNNDDDDVNSSSDSESGYRAHAYVSNFEKSSSSSSFQLSSIIQTPNSPTLVNPKSLLVPSLFPNVPPYLAFSTHIDKGPELPPQLHKILKWKLTTIMPKVVRKILSNSGFRLLKKTNDWMGTWGKHMKSPCFRAIRSYQKINHLPGSFKIGRKDSCWKNLQIQMARHGKKEFGFMPKTYIIPQDLKILRKSWPRYAQRNFKWIIKPPASARGTGIKVVNRWSQIPKRRPLIVQRYIERPFLINNSKFDLRLYVLVTSINPLRVYMYHDGLVRFASVKYSDKLDTLNDRCMHLTNYSINKFSSNYAKNEDVYACHGHKWTIKSLWTYFEKRRINTNGLWNAFRNLILRTLLAGENSINAMIKLNVESKYNCFELFGFDILLDSELVPWLLEVNISPSLHSELPLDLHVKAPLVQAVFNTALYHIPPKLSMDQQKELLNQHGLQGPLCFDKRLYVTYLSRAEKLKHQQFTRKSLEDRDNYLTEILENLTPDDIRCLITTEDELSRSAPLERIFPTQYTHKYLKYTETPRYYNRLLDAWEHKYGKDRSTGINYLKELCEQKLHLDTPPAPMRRQIKIRTRTMKLKAATIKSGWALTTAVKSIKKRNKTPSRTSTLMKFKKNSG